MLPKPPHDVPPPSEAWLVENDDELWLPDESPTALDRFDPDECDEPDDRLLEQPGCGWLAPLGAIVAGRSGVAQSSGDIIA
jgi:hypothetical protein